MIGKIFLAAFLFEIISAPIICAVASWIIGTRYDHQIKFVGLILQKAGEELQEIGNKKKEGDKNGES